MCYGIMPLFTLISQYLFFVLVLVLKLSIKLLILRSFYNACFSLFFETKIETFCFLKCKTNYKYKLSSI